MNSIGAWWPSDGVLGPVERHPLARHFLERCPEGRHMPRWVENKVNKNNEVRLIINLAHGIDFIRFIFHPTRQ